MTRAAEKNELMSVKEVARRLGIGTTTAWALIREREIPAVRVKGAVRVRLADIERYMTSHPY